MLNTNYLLIIYLCATLSVACTSGKPANGTEDTLPDKERSMLYIENDRIKLGVDLSLGGAVTYLSDKANGGKNMINSYDWGRQIQMSYYSGPWPYIGPNGERPAPEWEGLGWNPIQSGDAGGNRSKIVAYEKRGNNAIFVSSIPMQWPHKSGVPGECRFECLYTLTGNVITMEATLVNQREDKKQYRACPQEMPAVYTNGPWYKLVTYLGDNPFADEPVTVIVDKNNKRGWPWVNFYTPENWAALLDDNGYGIGVFQPEVVRFNGGFHPNDSFKGHGGEKDGQTGHIAPIGKEILDHNIRLTYKTTFILGTLDDIRSFVRTNRTRPDNPVWDFSQSRNHWYYQGEISDNGFPVKEGLEVQFGKGGSLVGPETFWKASNAASLEIEGSFLTTSGTLDITVELQPVGKSDFTDWLNWSEGEFSMEDEKREKAGLYPEKQPIVKQQQIIADGVNRSYRIGLNDISDYLESMKGIKIAFSEKGNATIRSIRLTR